MTEEIKEILDSFTKFKDKWYSCEYIMKPEQCILLLDYITNLQQENKRLQENNQSYQEEMGRTWKIADDYKSRFEKTIKDIDLIMTGNYEDCGTIYMQSSCCNKRLEIIKKDLIGSDENE